MRLSPERTARANERMNMTPDDPRISTSARQVQPFLAMEIFERSQELERQGIDIVHLEVGEPDFSVPACVDRAISKVKAGL